uniref:Uncharacterized protein n=1 Tax=Moniliophthora roreri TaxID=221103 RepID=A0A0W0FLV1_MONRR
MELFGNTHRSEWPIMTSCRITIKDTLSVFAPERLTTLDHHLLRFPRTAILEDDGSFGTEHGLYLWLEAHLARFDFYFGCTSEQRC